MAQEAVDVVRDDELAVLHVRQLQTACKIDGLMEAHVMIVIALNQQNRGKF